VITANNQITFSHMS